MSSRQLFRVAVPRRPGTGQRFRLAPCKDSVWHRGHDRCEMVGHSGADADEDADSDLEDDYGEGPAEASASSFQRVSPMDAAASADLPEKGSTPIGYEEVYGNMSKKRLNMRFWHKNENWQFATRRPPPGASQLLDTDLVSKLGGKEDVYRLIREAYGVDDEE
mmetsp:Transcript_26662/g.62172  ORF Transcript_26662/g.62172 Transcript_26662/m.62172 type:complete len:163 (+) Transcript_26662:112-600(+)|eukprot:CAMPEP_0178440396 /NCGR_PEP_ID=MMETSP0689_2-20121128/36760_1 /TAXON_ID=160604 /ORGANISM="Amphidinium massartii, Strain CS-259" /LENGTH=162 /DNA_ID=CAMNT_0020063175 /DNA_START=14 /DNA_END=502 /DNA_ORIENTATION=+